MATASFGGPWTERKLEILRLYLDAYTTALKSQGFQLIYIDAFAGAGAWMPGSGYTSDDYGDFQELQIVSPRIALGIEDKQFDKLMFVEKDPDNAGRLMRLYGEFPDRSIEIINKDANDELPIICDRFGNYDRAVVFLDPYATQVSWDTVARLASTQKVDCWILFPLMAITRMMPRLGEPSDALAEHLDRVFGGREHWRNVIYRQNPQLSMLDPEPEQQRPPGAERIANAYRKRLESAFTRVAPTPRVFRNSRNSPMFDLMFAASNPRGSSIAVGIADHILKNW